MNDSPEGGNIRIRDRLRGKRLLVTGATGLLGKVFVEKLLRSVPEVGRIFLLVRPRHDGMSAEQRLQREVLGSSVFDRLRAKLGPRFDGLCAEKIELVSGDLTLPRIGLSDEDYLDLSLRIDIIVNSAATVTFDERLDLALLLNVEGPPRLLELAKKCPNATFMQVSTCYVNGRRSGDIPETLAGPVNRGALDVESALCETREACDRILSESSDNGESQRRDLISAGMRIAHRYGWNDTYTFTKWLGEQSVASGRGDVPVVILRPAIIESSLAEPVPGWIDGLRMADPMIIAYGRGKLREFPAYASSPMDIIPVDLVANAMIAALQVPGEPPGLKIYQVGSSARDPMRCREMKRYLEEAFRRRPMTDGAGRNVRVKRFRLVGKEAFDRKWRRRLARASRFQRWLVRFNGSRLRRRQVASVIARIEQLIYFAKIYSPYTRLDCRFLDDKLRSLEASLHPDDRITFPVMFDPDSWRDYIVNRHIPGLRKFVLGGPRGGQAPPPPTETVLDDRRLIDAVKDTETIFEAFASVAGLARDKVALQVNRGGKWICYTYEDVLGATAAIVERFREAGLARGDRIVICGENCPEWGLVFLAAMRAGLTAVPLDPQLGPDEIIACARYTSAKFIAAGRTMIEGLSSAVLVGGEDGSDPLPVVLMAEPFVPPPGASRDADAAPARLIGEDVASILFTSGTTVDPKAVMLTHTNLLSNARAIREVQPHGAEDRFLSVLPLYHAFSFTTSFLVPLLAGATVTHVEQLKGPHIVEAMCASKTTVMLVVPRLLRLFHDGIQRSVYDSGALTRVAFRLFGSLSELSGRRLGRTLYCRIHRRFGGHLRLIVSGGAALDPELHAAFGRLGFVVAEGYGLTETSPVLTVNGPDGGKPGSAGRALPGVELEVRSPNGLGVGELWARGPNVMTGYLDNPQATAAVLRDGWFRTGDLCRFDSEDYIYILGRVEDTIVTDAGKNVYPDEVELCYSDLPYVKEMCVLGVPNAGGVGESIHAVIVPDLAADPDLDPSSMERAIREEIDLMGRTLPSHQRIQTLHFRRTELPKTSTLKAKRREICASILREKSPAGAAPARRVTDRAAAASESKDALADGPRAIYRLLSRVTETPVSEIDPESNLLLDLGIDSLMKLYVISELESLFEFTCKAEVAAGLSRVKDLIGLVGNRALAKADLHSTRSWRSWLQRDSAAGDSAAVDSTADGNGQLSLPLLPVRWAARGGLAAFFKSYVRVVARGVHHIPSSGPFILAANHASHLDSGAVLTAVGGRRRVSIAAAQDYFFDTRIKRWVLNRLFDAIPFDRHSDGLQGLRRCTDVLRRGDGLLFLPEGTRSKNGKIQPFKNGVAVMAVEAEAPIIPTRIENAFELLAKNQVFVRPGVIKVTFGKPIPIDSWKRCDDLAEQHGKYRELSRLVQTRVEALGAVDRAFAGKESA